LAEGSEYNQLLLDVKDLKKHFPITHRKLISSTVSYVKAVEGVTFYVREGQTLGLVGESGCGKTTSPNFPPRRWTFVTVSN
jgi:ABC-type oligopeptide transport system ATPase subunit